MILLFFWYCLIVSHNNGLAGSYIYPVAQFNNQTKIMLAYQKSLLDIQLWVYCTKTDTCMQVLSSSFSIPTHIRILPSQHAFSFIDQGYIKIKEFTKRSARTIPIYNSIDFFCQMEWIDDENFYFLARQGDYFQIFKSDLNGIVQQITNGPCDALYPCKLGSNIWYAQRNTEKQTTIYLQSCKSNQKEKIISMPSEKEQVCYIKMKNDQLGTIVSIQKNISTKNGILVYPCNYYHLHAHDNNWHLKKLFTFYVKADYLEGPIRLHESIEQFIPREDASFIYFCDWSSDDYEFYDFSTYNIATQSISHYHIHRPECQIFIPHTACNVVQFGLILPQNSNYSFQEAWKLLWKIQAEYNS